MTVGEKNIFFYRIVKPHTRMLASSSAKASASHETLGSVFNAVLSLYS